MDAGSSSRKRNDDFLRSFRPVRRVPVDRWTKEAPRWDDFDFLSEEELERWTELRYEALLTAGNAAFREPGNGNA